MGNNNTLGGNNTHEVHSASWVIIARFAIEGVTQGIVGLFGLLGNCDLLKTLFLINAFFFCPL